MSLPRNDIAPTPRTPGHAGPGGGGPRTVILFDGVCDLCNSGVAWIRARDRASAFEYLPLQSPEVARR
jgi:hypothetical protein